MPIIKRPSAAHGSSRLPCVGGGRRDPGVRGGLLGGEEHATHRRIGDLLAATDAGLLRGHSAGTSICDFSRRTAIRYDGHAMLILSELKTQALRYVVLGDQARAFRTYEAIVRAVPTDLDARMKVADLCVQARLHDLARRVYA